MWVLSTDRAELHYFTGPEVITGGYAILSHTWSPTGEQTLQQVRAIGERCRQEGTNPRDHVDSKIRGCCVLAEKEGFRWVWIDSCCIDKTSSTELSESINSMFQWYCQAEVCYAYLADVSGGWALDAQDSPFRKSRWHTRGWTLQELIAPAVVVFFSSEWREIGTKATLAGLLSQITGIPWTVFTRQRLFSNFSIAQRMCWAIGRSTTRQEDEAYSLMGLFGVSIPTNYGEGHNAFYRLQYEIMKHSSDMSLFAWGTIIHQCCRFGSEDAMSSGARDAFKYLLASSPKDFESPSIYTPTLVKCEHVQHTYPPSGPSTEESQAASDHQNGPFDRVELPQVTFTSYGVECRLPVIDARDVTIALLLCQLPSREHIGLILMRDPASRDAYRPLYHAGCGLRRAKPHFGSNSSIRLVSLGQDLHNIHFDGMVVRPEWRTIYIVTSPPAGLTSTHSSISRLSFNCAPNPFVYFPHWLLSRLAMLNFQALEQTCAHRHGVRFVHPTGEHITVEIGVCSNLPHQRWDGIPTHWARVSCSRSCPHDGDAHVHDGHDCSKDHVLTWPLWSKEFGTKERTVRLSFVPHERARKAALVVHLELKGAVYEHMLHKAQTVIPSQEELEMTRAFPKERWGDRRLALHLRGSVGYREFLQSQLWRLGPYELGLGLCGPSSARSHKSGRILITHAHPARSRIPFIVREEFRLIYPYVDISAGQTILRLRDDISLPDNLRWDPWSLNNLD